MSAATADQRASFEKGLAFAGQQCRQLIDKHPDFYPMYTVKGRWPTDAEAWTHWCDGFYPGIFWLLLEHTGDAYWREQAERYTRPLEPRKLDRNVHDLGFIFNSTYLRWYRLTNDSKLHEIIVQAGRTLALRRQKGGYLASFIGPESLFIDIMMNVGLILWTANETGDQNLRDIALEHCRTTAKHLVRDDGGTAHEGIFDLETGAFVRQSTHQGWNAESTWTRGLAWALYGFTTIYQLSGEAEFLAVAQRCADCYLRRAPEGLVPAWDFDIPKDEPQLYDSSAAAIAASGFCELARSAKSDTDKMRYQDAAHTALSTLCSDKFLAVSERGWEGILLHGIYHFHKDLGVDESVAWGDYFFVEGLVKVLT